MPKKLQTAKTLLSIYGWILIVVGAVIGIFVIIAAVMGYANNADNVGIAGIVTAGFIGSFALVCILAWGIFHVIVAGALAKQKHWSKVAAIILGVLMLGSFPLGTIFGIFILIGIFDKDSEHWLNGAGVHAEATNNAPKA